MAGNRRKGHNELFVAGWVVFAVIARALGTCKILPIPLGLVHTAICIGICIGWGISVHRRIVHDPVRKFMLGVSAMAVFWFVTRSVKYYFTQNPHIARYMWYSYYVPMLFIPVLVVLVALCLGKPENYRSAKWVWLLAVPAVLSLTVLTNDRHQLVFTFPEGQVWTDDAYGYGKAYYLILVCEFVCILAAFVIMLAKCRLARRKQYLPAILILLVLVYCILYVTAGQYMIFRILGGDLVMVLSLLLIGILESDIRCGLIQTNSGYAELFAVGTVGAQITDSDYQVKHTSANAPLLSQVTMEAANSGTVSLDKNTLLKGQHIKGGHVFWREDITDLTAVLEKMEKNRATIARNNYIEGESLRVKRELHALREKNRLYDLLQAKISPQIALLDRLFSQYDMETDDEKRRSLLGKIVVVGAYIKRSGNLLFISEKSEVTDTAELALCMEESFASLFLMGVECAMDIPGSHIIATKDAVEVYDIFEQIIETAIDSLHSLWLKARILEDTVIFRLDVECEASLSDFAPLVESCHFDEGVWSFAIPVGKVGDAL